MLKLYNLKHGQLPEVNIASVLEVTNGIERGYPYITPVHNVGLYLPYDSNKEQKGISVKGKLSAPPMIAFKLLSIADIGTSLDKPLPTDVWSSDEETFVVLDVIRNIVYLTNKNELDFISKTMILFNNLPVTDLQIINNTKVWFVSSNLHIKE